jgi:hypothetical protein
MPELSGKNSGDPIKLVIKFFLGHTEIKVDSQIENEEVQRHVYIYDEISEVFLRTEESVDIKDTVKKYVSIIIVSIEKMLMDTIYLTVSQLSLYFRKSLFRFINSKINI